MAITIKEICVRTTVSRKVVVPEIPEELILRIRESILRELKEEERKKTRKKNER